MISDTIGTKAIDKLNPLKMTPKYTKPLYFGN